MEFIYEKKIVAAFVLAMVMTVGGCSGCGTSSAAGEQ